jgi:hypothetical protein
MECAEINDERGRAKQMSVLKKIGIFMAGAGSDITKILGLPFISQLLGVIPGKLGQVVNTAVTDVRIGVADMNTIAGILSMAEMMYPSNDSAKTGSQKLTAAAPVMGKMVLAWAESNLPGHNKLLVPPEVFAAKVQAWTSDTADLLNCFGE